MIVQILLVCGEGICWRLAFPNFEVLFGLKKSSDAHDLSLYILNRYLERVDEESGSWFIRL